MVQWQWGWLSCHRSCLMRDESTHGSCVVAHPPLCYLCEALWPEGAFCVDVQRLALSTAHVDGQLQDTAWQRRRGRSRLITNSIDGGRVLQARTSTYMRVAPFDALRLQLQLHGVRFECYSR